MKINKDDQTINYKDIREKVNKNHISFMVELGRPGTAEHTFDDDELVKENIKKYINEYIDENENIIDESLTMIFYENIYGFRFVRVSYNVYDINKEK